jgi:hypothetical protein
MLQINNSNILNITNDDYDIIYHSDSSNINRYKMVFRSYLLKCHSISNNTVDRLIRLKVATEIIKMLDTKAGHELLKNCSLFLNSVINKIQEMMMYMILKFY